MGAEDCNIKAFLAKINSVSSEEAVWLANREATDVERLLLKDKSLTGANRDKITSYAEQLKEFIMYERSTLGHPRPSKRCRRFSD